MRGVTVTLKSKTQTGTDALGQPVYETKDVAVNDVLVGLPESSDIQNALTLYGKKITYTLAIPKGDTNVWYKHQVTLPAPWSETFNVIGDVTETIDANTPTRWNRKVQLERIDG